MVAVPTDYAQLRENLRRFYDFTGKTVLFVGAGTKQLLDPHTQTERLVAIDRDAAALKDLASSLASEGRSAEVVAAPFEAVTIPGDVVYFEFCLHEMADPHQALGHARTLAPEIVVFDHSPGSEWVYYGAEEDVVRRSNEAMEQFGIRRRKTYHAEQRFRDHEELLAKVRPQGTMAIERARRFAGVTDIVIPMTYQLALL